MSAIQATPPHFPTYNVRLSTGQIQATIRAVFPGHHCTTIEQLESGKSYNNRIYFVTTSNSAREEEDVGQKNLVLKVAGHYFGARKIQNEVSSLMLLGKYCPNVPTPRVLAWSETGRIIQTSDGRSISVENEQPRDEVAAGQERSWTLLSRLPGRSLNIRDLEGEYGSTLIGQIASHVTDWRTNMPRSSCIGNLHFAESSDTSSSAQFFAGLGFAQFTFGIGGQLLCQLESLQTFTSVREYYTHLVDDALEQSKTKPILRPLYDRIGVSVQKFMTDVMPSLVALRDDKAVKFTHFDLSPRNVLVSDTAGVPHVTGILDTEFSGYFPFYEEFINAEIRQSDDWTAEQYDLLLREMVKYGCEVPPSSCLSSESERFSEACDCEFHNFKAVCELSRIIANVAPWDAFEGSMPDDELQVKLNKAGDVVAAGIGSLSSTYSQ